MHLWVFFFPRCFFFFSFLLNQTPANKVFERIIFYSVDYFVHWTKKQKKRKEKNQGLTLNQVTDHLQHLFFIKKNKKKHCDLEFFGGKKKTKNRAILNINPFPFPCPPEGQSSHEGRRSLRLGTQGDGDLHQRPRGSPGHPLPQVGNFVLIGHHPGDIQMRPVSGRHKLLQEGGGCTRSTWAVWTER